MAAGSQNQEGPAKGRDAGSDWPTRTLAPHAGPIMSRRTIRATQLSVSTRACHLHRPIPEFCDAAAEGLPQRPECQKVNE